MPELLLEVGCEELPATFVRKAYTDLAEKLSARLTELGVSGGSVTALGTPRRLIVIVSDVPERQADSVKAMRGPGLKAAYDAEGKPAGPLLGFLRGQGVDLSAVRDDGQYIWIDKEVPGRPTAELLAEELPAAIRGLSFDKSMRWGSSRMRFARPLRWLLATFGGAVVPFEIEGVVSGNQSRGHRFYAPTQFEASTSEQLLTELRARFVEPDPTVRRTMIEEGSKKVAEPGQPDLPDALVDENTFLTEWPTPIVGEFKTSFQGLPEPVLVTAMAKHEKMFPVRENGALTNRFVFVRNSGEDDSVRAGAEWVLNARFNDAKFFAEGDAEVTLSAFLERTSDILFAEKLGTVKQRALRLGRLASLVFPGDSHETELALDAGLYAKADLASGLVSELASLQGIIGGEYAQREGKPAAVVYAISHQYDPNSIGEPKTVEARTAWRLVVADALDKLAGYLGIGRVPSGSSDPFALRRAATQVIEAAWLWETPIDLTDGFEQALEGYKAQGIELNAEAALASFREVLSSRYATLLPEVRHDILDAALSGSDAAASPQAVRFRTSILARLIEEHPSFVTTATRPLNLVAAATKKEIEFSVTGVDLTALDSVEGASLLHDIEERGGPLSAGVATGDVNWVIRLLLELEAPINLFLDKTMIMVDETKTRAARLTLLSTASQLLLRVGDFSKLEG